MSEATATATAERLSGREAAIARRQALSLHGKGALKAGSTAAPKSATEARPAARPRAPAPPAAAAPAEAPNCGCQHGETFSARVEEARPATPVALAPVSAVRQRRIKQSQRGRGDAPPCRPCGRIKPEPPKVEIGTTLAGSTVTGNELARTSKVTGGESGASRNITGSAYADALVRPSAEGNSPKKVETRRTSNGAMVSGTLPGRSPRLSGDEPGACARVTGSDC